MLSGEDQRDGTRTRTYCELEHSSSRSGAEEGTRTPTVLPPLGPEPSASTNSATSARRARILTERRCQRDTNEATRETSETPTRRVRRTPTKHRPARATIRIYEREQRRYEEPLPSREYILEVLHEQGVPVAEDELAQLLEIKRDERSAFQRRLAAMERDGEIMRNRRNAICVVAKLDLMRGRVQGHPDGYGFLVRDDGGPDLFLSFGEMQKVLHGDRVMARDLRRRPPRPAAKARSSKCSSARSSASSGGCAASTACSSSCPRTSASTATSSIPPDESAGAQPGQVVTVEIIVQPAKHVQPVGARRRGARQLRRSRHGNRDRAAQARSAARFLARGGAAVRALPDERDRSRPRRARGPARAAARHDRRRDREGFRRRGVLRAARSAAAARAAIGWSSRSPT